MIRSKKTGFISIALLCLSIAACSQVSKSNYDQIKKGMTKEQATNILGEPSQSNSTNILGNSGESATWISGDKKISIIFVNGKVTIKSFNQGQDSDNPKKKELDIN